MTRGFKSYTARLIWRKTTIAWREDVILGKEFHHWNCRIEGIQTISGPFGVDACRALQTRNSCGTMRRPRIRKPTLLLESSYLGDSKPIRLDQSGAKLL